MTACDRPCVSVIVPAWNVAGALERCLDSIERQEVPGGVETIVIENASADGTREILERRGVSGRVVWNDRNPGFTGSNNQGAALAKGDVLLFLNADTELLGTDAIAVLAAALEEPGVGIAGPLLLYPDGSLQPTCAAHPSVLRAVILGAGIHRLLPGRIRRTIVPEFWCHGESIDTGWLNFAALAVRADLFRSLGGCWRTEYGEDEDLAYRAQLRGYRVRYVSEARAIHVGNFSFGQQRSAVERGARVAMAELTFLRTHYRRPRAAVIRTLVGAGYSVRAVVLRALGRPQRASIYRAMASTYARFDPAAGARSRWSVNTSR